MKEIFLGFVFDRQKEEDLLSVCKCGVSMAVNQYQLGFLQGLGRKMDVISALCIGAYPQKCEKLVFEREKTDFLYGEIEYLPFWNFYFLREKMFGKYAYEALKERISDDEETVIYLYSLYLPYMKAIQRLKREHKNVRCCIIVTDLPGQYGFLAGSKSLQGIRDRAEEKKKFKLSEIADSFVFLTDHMKELFPSRPSVVIEGFLPQTAFDYSQKRAPKSILYTGSLNTAFGVQNLLEAFAQIKDPEYQLWICGAGGIQQIVEEYANRDHRIKYFGFLPKDEIAKLQTRCDVLINPRQGNNAYTKYSFPSKTMEYLLSGSKVVMYPLAGIPCEYYDHIYTVDGDTVDDLQKVLCMACSDQSFYETRSGLQIQWMQENKTAQTQIEKLSKMKW